MHPHPLPEPGSNWTVFTQRDICTWMPVKQAVEQGTLDNISAATAAGYERINDHDALVLFSILADVRVMYYGEGENVTTETWAPSEAIERARLMPVALAFPLPATARPLLQRATDMVSYIPVVEFLPPPMWGEMALVQVGDAVNMQPLRLSMLGDDGLALWQRLGRGLADLTAPAEWWPFHPLYATCATPGGYERMKDAYHSTILNTTGEARKSAKWMLSLLEKSRHQVAAVQAQIDRAQTDKEAYQTQVEEVRSMALQLTEMYWRSYQAATADTRQDVTFADVTPTLATARPLTEAEREAQARIDIVRSIEGNSSSNTIETSSHAPDVAVREAASVGRKGFMHNPPEIGDIEGAPPKYFYYHASNALNVSMGDPEHPMPLDEAHAYLLRISDSTVVTARIAIALWNIRKHEERYIKAGAVAISYREILEWQGATLHRRAAYPGSSQMVSDGYETRDKQRVKDDLILASNLHIWGTAFVTFSGKQRNIILKGPYMSVTTVAELPHETAPLIQLTLEDASTEITRKAEDVGAFIQPGAWVGQYQENDNHFWAHADRRVFELRPHDQQHELRLALYLMERWRSQANKRNYSDPIIMRDLLASSVIEVNRKNLTNRFAGRIEEALQELCKRGIVGSAECLTPPDKTKGRWGADWLAAQWRILPPIELTQHYVDSGVTPLAIQARRKGTKVL